jgi:hypothetical protein
MKYLFVALIFVFTSFRPTRCEVTCRGIEGNGLIQLMVGNSQLGSKYKIELAKKDALYAVLYTGASGCGKVNHLLSSTESIQKFKKIQKKFFSKNGKWSKYTRQSTTPSVTDAVGQYVIVVDLPLLRRDLENLNIIKSMTDGF